MKRSVALFAGLVVGLTLIAPASASHLRRTHEIKLRPSGLEHLDQGFYELWAVHGERKISAGSFNVDSEGMLVDGFGHRARFFSSRNPARADALVVTIEPLPDPDPDPSGIVVLTGRPRGNSARLSFPADLSEAGGSFILATPTDEESTNETAGVWFLDPDPAPGPSLQLPDLPDGWIWEGWGVTQDTPLSSGRFGMAAGADDSSEFSGPLPGPPFPGEDFLSNLPQSVDPPVDLADGSSAIVITIEPDLGGNDPTGAGPFSIKPLLRAIPAGSADHQSIELVRDLSSVPGGKASY
ncbi:MAG: hypothetical protein M3279_11455 [Actinomycetota bacterium]|nr:hypothetical protein [Actinomycetota bacterium]